MTCICTDNTCFPTIPMPCCDGVPGATGPTGPAGTTILYNDMTTSTVTAIGSFTPFVAAKEYLIPNTLLSVGDKLRVTAIFEAFAAPESKIYIKLGGQVCNAVRCGASSIFIQMVTEISCKDITSASDNIYLDDKNYLNNKNQLPYDNECIVTTFAGQNLTVAYGTAPGVLLSCEAYINPPLIPGGTHTISCHQLTVEYLKMQ